MNPNVREAVTENRRLYITLRYMAAVNNIADLKFVLHLSQLEFFCAGDAFTVRQTDGN